jgi:hypothetical protein
MASCNIMAIVLLQIPANRERYEPRRPGDRRTRTRLSSDLDGGDTSFNVISAREQAAVHEVLGVTLR